tara:strand:- start:40 stop:1266 length:1227 start_codon:yes stop_codon:yes gene_type:complete
MVAQVAAADLILTTIGRVAIRPLAGYLAKNGGKKFAQQYGPKAFEAVLGTTVGLKAYKETEEYLSEYLNHIDEGGEEGSFVPKGSMPGVDRMTQMDTMMAVPTVNKKDDTPEQTDKLVRGIGDNNPPSPIDEEEPPQQEPPEGPNLGTEIADTLATEAVKKLADRKKEKSLTSQNFLDDDLMNDLLLMRGGIEGYKKNMAGEFPKMPASTKQKMEMVLQKKLFDKYKIHEYPEGESPENVIQQRKDYLIHTYNKRLSAIDYITSVAYDVIGRADEEAMLIVDEDGLPIAGAKVESKFDGPKTYNKDALTITEMGSIFKDAGDQLFNDIIKRAKDEGKKYIVAEDLTSEGALQALKDRGFRTPTTKDTKRFKGTKIRRPNGRTAYQKNLVLDLSKEIIKEQTDNLLKNK